MAAPTFMSFCIDNLDSLGRQNGRFESSGCFGYLEAECQTKKESNFWKVLHKKMWKMKEMWRFMYRSIPLIELYLKVIKIFFRHYSNFCLHFSETCLPRRARGSERQKQQIHLSGLSETKGSRIKVFAADNKDRTKLARAKSILPRAQSPELRDENCTSYEARQQRTI